MLPSQDDGDDVKFRPPGVRAIRSSRSSMVSGSFRRSRKPSPLRKSPSTVRLVDLPRHAAAVEEGAHRPQSEGLAGTAHHRGKEEWRQGPRSSFGLRSAQRQRSPSEAFWNAFNKFVRAATKAGLTKDQFQVFVSLHPAVISDPIAERVTKQGLAKTIAKLNADGLKGLENSPGIWGDVKLRGKKLSLSTKPVLDAFPASHHHKSVVVDHRIGFLGGANISDYFQDTSQHLNKEPAHDIYCRMEGPVVADLERNFVGRWNAESAAFNTFITTANAHGKALGKFKIDHPFPISTLTLSNAALGKQGNSVAQILRTLSSGIQSPIVGSYKVQAVRDDIARAYEKAISVATRFIYIENQAMRLDDLANWIIARFKKMPKLQVIIVLPVVPEEIADGTADEITFHGQGLQHDALKKLQGALGKNVGLYSLLQKKRSTGKMTFFNSVLIDVHCKILVVDDLYASIGSANTSPRSFSLDSEINVGWYEPDTVKKFREDLWKEHLGSPTGSLFAAWNPAHYVQEWDAVAAKNEKAKPELRQGFVVRHDPDKEKGKKTPLLPDFLAEVGHPDQVDPAPRPPRQELLPTDTGEAVVMSAEPSAYVGPRALVSPLVDPESITPVPGPGYGEFRTPMDDSEQCSAVSSPKFEFGYDDAELTDAWSEDVDSAESFGEAWSEADEDGFSPSWTLDEDGASQDFPASRLEWPGRSAEEVAFMRSQRPLPLECVETLKGTAKVPALKVAVVGGGLAGLMAARTLCREGVKVTVFEAPGRSVAEY